MHCQRDKADVRTEIEQTHKTCAYDECPGSEGSEVRRRGSDRLAFATSLASLRVPIRVLPISSTYSIRAKSSSSTWIRQLNSHSMWVGSRGHTEGSRLSGRRAIAADSSTSEEWSDQSSSSHFRSNWGRGQQLGPSSKLRRLSHVYRRLCHLLLRHARIVAPS